MTKVRCRGVRFDKRPSAWTLGRWRLIHVFCAQEIKHSSIFIINNAYRIITMFSYLRAADDEETQAVAGGNGADGDGEGKGQMLYIPGIGYIPLSSLGGLPGLNLGGARQAQAAPNPEGERDWKGLADMPAVTQGTIEDLTKMLQDDDKDDLTILLLGKGGVGKSSTVNSLLNEKAANVLPFQQDNARPIVFSRRMPSGFVLHLIDTPSLLDQDAVSEGVRRYYQFTRLHYLLY